VAGLINSARYWSLLHGFDLTNSEDMELAFFARVAACPDTPEAIAAVDGLELLDVLEMAQRVGFDVGAQAPLVPDFSAIHLPDEAAIQDAIATKGSAYIGVKLYEADMQPGAAWVGGLANAGAFIGGHCILQTWDGVATWGEILTPDQEWLMSRMDEAYALTWTFAV
jgi:hypothetical protein